MLNVALELIMNVSTLLFGDFEGFVIIEHLNNCWDVIV